MQYQLQMFLPRPNGTRDVPCANSNRRTRACLGYATFDAENRLIAGIAIQPATRAPRFVCTWKCAATYAKRK